MGNFPMSPQRICFRFFGDVQCFFHIVLHQFICTVVYLEVVCLGIKDARLAKCWSRFPPQ